MSLLQLYMLQRHSLVGPPPGQSFDSLFSFIADSTAFSLYAVSDISRYTPGPNYVSIWPACHQLLQLPSSLAELPRVPPFILNSFPLVSEEKENLSLSLWSVESVPFCTLLDLTPSRYPSILLTWSCIYPLVLKHV